MNVSFYQLYLVADQIRRRIEDDSTQAEVNVVSILPQGKYSSHGFVSVTVEWPWGTDDDIKRRWAERYAEKFGGEVTEKNPGYGEFDYLEIQDTATHGIQTRVLVGRTGLTT
ncbi:hypothetical protein HWC33_gp16 [Microbacterium phage TinyTimothy]|uniref:Uncharacterized protein n=1 Tax=Microbacterium phage TinyTimothy TaxID=2583039 RepID=A0A4Y6ENT3_9CAUD|nr:hypothetical protein HWC33_gp16 [Microbacterium phage TinyTimothy]QDF16969.1 hypothetical protein SEA_TINYTIMOTHY_16 [Microbacterium phage TinyTimothy]